MRPFSLIRLKQEYMETHSWMFRKETFLIYLGEIPNMPGHCILLGNTTGKAYCGMHIEDFEEIPEEEI